MMTPALGLFYAGLVRSKNTLNTFMMSMAALGVATICWAVVGYSLAFSGGEGGFIGNLDFAFLNGVGFEPREGTTIPQLLFMVFQGAFCILTVALVSGAVVERIWLRPVPDLRGALVDAGLSGDGPLGLRRRLPGQHRHARLRRRHFGRDGLWLPRLWRRRC